MGRTEQHSIGCAFSLSFSIIFKLRPLTTCIPDVSIYRPVYAPKDLLEVLLSLKGPTHQDDGMYPKWEFSHIAISVKNLFELRVHYLDLIRNDHKSDNWLEQCRKVVEQKHAPLSQHILKKGITPAPHRGALWAQVLGSQVKNYVSNCMHLC